MPKVERRILPSSLLEGNLPPGNVLQSDLGPAGFAHALYGADTLSADMPVMLVEGKIDALTVQQVAAVATGQRATHAAPGGWRSWRWPVSPLTTQTQRKESDMISDEQLERLRNLARLYSEELPDDGTIDALVLLYDVCEILDLSAEKLAYVFGPAVLTWVTGLVYGEEVAG